MQQITLSAPETVIISGKGSDDKGEGDDEVAPPDKRKRDRPETMSREIMAIEDSKMQGVLMGQNSRLQFPAKTEDESRYCSGLQQIRRIG